MRRTAAVFIAVFLSLPRLSAEADKSKYKAATIARARDIEMDTMRGGRYKSVARLSLAFRAALSGGFIVECKDSSGSASLRFDGEFPSVPRFTLMTFYYRYEWNPKKIGCWREILDGFDVCENRFVKGESCAVSRETPLRKSPDEKSAETARAMPGERLVVAEEGREDTVGGETSSWVKARLPSGAAGWLFGAGLTWWSGI